MKADYFLLPLPSDQNFTRELDRLLRQYADAINAVEMRSGPTVDRPVGADLRPGRLYNDTTLNKLIRWSGTAWTNADGTAL